MHDAVSLAPTGRERRLSRLLSRLRSSVRAQAPARVETALAVLSALLLILSFPDFNLWPLAWIGLVPLLVAVVRAPQLNVRAFLLGWIAGTLFFYGSCYWLTYSMVRYGHIPKVIAYLLLFPITMIVGLFPALSCLVLARLVARWGVRALLLMPLVWVAFEWARLGVTGQLWNAIGYSQAYMPQLIRTARWGGVYAVGFLIVLSNAALAFLLLKRSLRALAVSTAICAGIALIIALPGGTAPVEKQKAAAVVVAIQPNVPMEPVEDLSETEALIARHLSLSASALSELKDERAAVPRVVIWPESPMNFTYARDSEFRETVAGFTSQQRTSVIFNALEPAPANGDYNSAVMVNEDGRLVAQYDKIRLLPFGEYVPLPRWLPGVNLVPVMVGDFTPGAQYPLLPLGEARAGIFICFESAFPSIARRFADEGADVLINISNDGYLGPTPVMRQHLANAIFRAVENDRPVLRVTNTGISAYITPRGEVLDATGGFQTATRTWTVTRTTGGKTFYTAHGDLFVALCAALSLLLIIMSLKSQVPRPKSGSRT
ncbi:MAG: apolipoprotein N-acyltransferase [Acidobacteria bacterium]|nr:apolipoprotein N-acyltransferase [Acidobacteriota bacterium]